jgi:hypothetical protein
MDNNVNERWLTRPEPADRDGLSTKTLAQGASKGIEPTYATMGRHVRYRLSDLIEWETERIDDLREAAQPVTSTDRAFEHFTRPASHDGKSDSIRSAR